MQKKLSKKYLLILLFPIAFFLNMLSRSNSGLTEKYYSTGIYPGISRILGSLIGWIPFSLAEILVPILAVLAIWALIKWSIRLIKSKDERWIVLRNGILNILLAISLVYSAFIFLWGLNYNRQSLGTILDLDVRNSNVEELVMMTEELLENTNALREQVDEDERGVMVPFNSVRESFSRAREGYLAAAEYIPGFDGVYGKPKPLLFSPMIAYTNIWGIYIPFTAEPNVNMKVPTPMMGSTMMHEMAHQLGFAREDEANYIAFLTCSLHPDVDFQYSGHLSALNYSLNAIYGQDVDAYKDLYSRLSDGVKSDYAENSRYHK